MGKSFVKKILIAAVSLFIGMLPLAARAQTTDPCASFKSQFTLSTTSPNGPVNIIGNTAVYCSAPQLILTVTQYAIMLAGSIAVLFLIVGGFWYLTSAGNEEQSEKGKKTLINSIIGLAVIILATAIVRIVSSALTLGK